MDTDAQSKYAIHEAAREGRTTAVESLLNANSKLAILRDPDDRLPVHWACAYGHLPILHHLAGLRSFDPDVKDGSGWTPLHIVSSLKSSPLTTSTTGTSTETETPDPLPLATLLLSKGAEVNEKTNNGQTVLHFAASKGNIDVVRLLVEKGASTRIRDKRGQLPIHRAAASGAMPVLNLLIEKKSPLDASDVDSMTALHHAISEGHGDAAVALLKAGAATDRRDGEGRLAIELAPDSKVRKYILQSAEREGIDFE